MQMKCKKSAKFFNARGRCYLVGFSILSFFPIGQVVTTQCHLLLSTTAGNFTCASTASDKKKNKTIISGNG